MDNNKKLWTLFCVLLGLVIVMFGIIISLLNKMSKQSTVTAHQIQPPEIQAEVIQEPEQTPEPEPIQEPEPEPIPSEISTEPEQRESGYGETMSQKNALKKAQHYLSLMAYSYDGLVNQLKYEGFDESDAVYGVENCGADWYEQAVKKSEHYLSLMSYSRDGLISQLKYEGFSEDQAVYAADQVGF